MYIHNNTRTMYTVMGEILIVENKNYTVMGEISIVEIIPLWERQSIHVLLTCAHAQ